MIELSNQTIPYLEFRRLLRTPTVAAICVKYKQRLVNPPPVRRGTEEGDSCGGGRMFELYNMIGENNQVPLSYGELLEDANPLVRLEESRYWCMSTGLRIVSYHS